MAPSLQLPAVEMYMDMAYIVFENLQTNNNKHIRIRYR